MTDGEALIQAVRENPLDDTPRLIYADWLEEHGTGWRDPARALFIRVQCQAARLEPDDPLMPRYTKLMEEMRTACENDWLAPLVELDWFGWEELKFRRGFLEDLYVLTEHFDFAEVGERFLRREHVDSVGLSGSPATVAVAAGQPSVGLLGSLNLLFPGGGADSIEPGRGDAAVEAVAQVPRRTPLRAFGANHSGLSDQAARVLAASQVFDSLQHLSLFGTRITADGVKSFRNAVFAPAVESVRLKAVDGPWLGAERGKEVAEAFALGGYTNLTKLDLAGYPLGDEGILALSRSPLARQLRSLDLFADRNLCGEGVFALFDSKAWPALRRLYVMPINSGPGDLRRLVSGDRFRTLHSFNAFCEHATAETAAQLAANPHVAGLETLGLLGRHVGDEGARALIGSPYLTRLKDLRLIGLNISEETMMLLADPATMPGLTSLTLTYLGAISPEAEAALRRRFGAGFEHDLNGA